MSASVSAPLPRHRHGLTRQEVAAAQRRRLVSATAEVVAELGYGATTVAAIIARAGVSRKTFYEQFADKEEAFLAAYAAIDEVIELLANVANGSGAHAGPRSTVRAVIGAYLDALASQPALTRMLVVEAVGAGPRILARRNRAFGQIAAALREQLERARGDDPALPEVDTALMVALQGAINELCLQQIVATGPEHLPEIAADAERVAFRICFADPA